MATQPTVFPQALDPESSYWQTMMKRYQEQMNQPVQPRFTPEQIEQRKGANAQQEQMGMLAMLSGDPTLQNLGGTIFKQSLEGRKAQVGTKGVYDPMTQTWTRDPNIQREDLQENLRRAEEGYARAQTQQQLEAQRAIDRRELKGYGASLKGGGGGATGLNPDGSMSIPSTGTFGDRSIGPNGETIVSHTKIGVPLRVEVQPDGSQKFFPFTGTAQGKTAFEKSTGKAQELVAAAVQASNVLNLVDQNSEAFGWKGGVMAASPTLLQGGIGRILNYTPEMSQARARVSRQAADEIHRLYGAAVTMGEKARADAWNFVEGEPLEMTVTKLRAARDWAREMAQLQGQQAFNTAGQRTGVDTSGWGGNQANQPTAPIPATTGRRKSDEGFSATIRSP